jgi:hypothetical protein
MNGRNRILVACLFVAGLASMLGLMRDVHAEPLGNDCQVLKGRTLNFDINIEEKEKASIRALELYISRPNGGVWELVNSVPPSAKTIPHTVKDDGPYLINIVTVYTDGSRDPADVTKSAPMQKLLIDSTAPILRNLVAERVGEQIRISWSVDDQHPNDASTKVEWKTQDASEATWKAVPLTTPDRRSAQVVPGSNAALMVRVTIEDVAGNTATQTKELNGERTSAVVPTSAITPASPTTAPVLKPDLGNLVMPNLTQIPLPSSSVLPPPMLNSPNAPITPPILPGPSLPTPPAVAGPSAPVVDLTPMTPSAPSGYPAPLATPALSSVPPAPLPTGPTPIAAGSGVNNNGLEVAAIANPNLPAAKPINFLRFDVSYNLEAGPSGISRLDLYVTRDDGRTWSKWSQHDGEQKPLRIALDTRGNVSPEGVYGFSLVATSGAGLSGPTPTDGTSPDFRVNVDLTPPMVRLFAPDSDATRPGALLLKWDVKDKNPSKDGLALAWSESPSGPWKSIGEDKKSEIIAGMGGDLSVKVPDVGSYAWKLPEKLPPKVFLRVVAWDAAGNRSDVTTPQPVLVDLTKPRARIQDVLPAALSRQ